ncbi:hypothetical protein EIN_274340 [Entamoeba invadens IP1]|uniref:Uncharacterized protein n=1 Tax=Entamoeba invadens IP1 TaxID=370355 RepID=A0A0A1U1H9_ENTIV|nr:hypothetical protein EIN_274340 [Entamoeba invadens IP1]ELP87867.1 hypothetical protein EIN_274340 [Entamoeba invadens IP1]|eukprot:XP_004254638.1 hypothetical protein EIN_274340 [Entamoeba invadens IP1]
MDETIIKYLRDPSNESKVLGIFLLTKKYEILLKKNPTTTLLSYSTEFFSYFSSIHPTFFVNYFMYLDTESPSAEAAETLLTIFKLFLNSDEVRNSESVFPILLGLFDRFFSAPQLTKSLSEVIEVIAVLLQTKVARASAKIFQILPAYFMQIKSEESAKSYSNVVTQPEYSRKISWLIEKFPVDLRPRVMSGIDVGGLTPDAKTQLRRLTAKMLSGKLNENYQIMLTFLFAKLVDTSVDFLSLEPLELIDFVIRRLCVEVRANLELTAKKEQSCVIAQALIVYVNHLIRFNEDDEEENEKMKRCGIDIEALGKINQKVIPVLNDLHADGITWIMEFNDNNLIEKVLDDQVLRTFVATMFQLILSLSVLILDLKEKNSFNLILPILKLFKSQGECICSDFEDLWKMWSSFEQTN